MLQLIILGEEEKLSIPEPAFLATFPSIIQLASVGEES
jgi:hypothetical protein